MIFTIITLSVLVAVFFKLFGFALRLGWGILKAVGFLVFFPVIMLALIFKGIIWLALPVLIIVWICGKFERA